MQLTRRQVRIAAAVLSACALAGCGGGTVEKVPVRGVVRLEAGPWPAGGNLSFVPLEAAAGRPLRPGWAVFDQEGAFAAGCFEDGDGLVPGRYAVNIDCWDVPAAGGGRGGPRSCVPDKYRRGFVELEVPAEATGPIEVEWTIPAS